MRNTFRVLCLCFRQYLSQKLRSIALPVFRHLFGCARRDDLSAAPSSVGTQVYDVVRHLDDVQVVLYDHYGVAGVREAVEDRKKFRHVMGVQSRSGLVQDVEGLSRTAFAEFGGEFHPLRLSPRKSRGGLPELDIAQSHVVEGLDAGADARHVFEKVQRLLHRHIQHFGDILPLIPHFQSLAVVSCALAHLAGDVDVGEEVHLDLDYAVAVTVLAPAARDVEGKSARLVSPGFRVGKCGKQLPYRREYVCVRRGIGARGPAYRALVYRYHLVEILHALYAVVFPLDKVAPHEAVGHGGIKYLVDQGGFAAPGHSRHGGEHSDGELHILSFQVVLSHSAR